MKIKDIRDKSTEELEGELEKLKKESFNLRFQKAGGQLENTARVRFECVISNFSSDWLLFKRYDCCI